VMRTARLAEAFPCIYLKLTYIIMFIHLVMIVSFK
jgi:hypothetical protein